MSRHLTPMNSDAERPPAQGYRLVPCTGMAHKPGNGHMDNCTLCAPRFGVVERLTPEAIRDIAQGYKRGGASSARELARALDHVLSALWPASANHARDLDVIRLMLAAYAPNVAKE